MATATKNRKTVSRSNIAANGNAATTTKPAAAGTSKLAGRISRGFVKTFTADPLLADAWSKLSDRERDAILGKMNALVDREIMKTYPAT